jgi:imidazolonepropionase
VTTAGRSIRPASGSQQADILAIPDGAIAIDKGVIVQIGTSDQILSQHRSERLIEATRRTALPGLIDPHTHLVFAGYRDREFEMKLAGKTYMEILAAGRGILSTVAERTKAPSALIC